jgi:hypothetical protein
MTKLQLIQMIGDVLTDLDVAIGSLAPNDPQHRQLLDLRLLLDDRQGVLSREVFVENSAGFQQAAQEIAAINSGLQQTIQRLDQLNATIDNVSRFLNALTSLVSTVAAVA